VNSLAEIMSEARGALDVGWRRDSRGPHDASPTLQRLRRKLRDR
jgi:hypothetical protein